LPVQQLATPVYLLIGTERGFCGDFNHALLRHLETSLQSHASVSPVLIAVGRKLYTLLEDDKRLAAPLDGASVVEEVTALLQTIVATLTEVQQQHGLLNVYCLYHSSEDDIEIDKIIPPFLQLLDKPTGFLQAPLLNLPPQQLLVDLTDNYLFAVLHEILYTSLMVENRHRQEHLEGAVRHLDEESEQLARQSNMLRQEEIIEEIEVILLSAASLGDEAGKRSVKKLRKTKQQESTGSG
jgi:F-type H+-transporting ATPase subunit gamma